MNRRAPFQPIIPAQAGIQVVHLIVVEGNQPYELDSRLRGNDGWVAVGRVTAAPNPAYALGQLNPNHYD